MVPGHQALKLCWFVARDDDRGIEVGFATAFEQQRDVRDRERMPRGIQRGEPSVGVLAYEWVDDQFEVTARRGITENDHAESFAIEVARGVTNVAKPAENGGKSWRARCDSLTRQNV